MDMAQHRAGVERVLQYIGEHDHVELLVRPEFFQRAAVHGKTLAASHACRLAIELQPLGVKPVAAKKLQAATLVAAHIEQGSAASLTVEGNIAVQRQPEPV